MLNYRYNLKELLDILEQKNELDSFIADIFRFNLICDENVGIEEILFDPHVTTASKITYMDTIIKPYLGTYFISFLEQLVANNDIYYYDYIRKKLVTLLGKEKNCHFVEVVSSIPLRQEYLQDIKKILEEKLQKTVFTYNSTSKKLRAGFIINCGEKMIDLSVQGSFEKLSATLHRH
jgi:F-type H+-transporting ATPase subunit delta